MMYRCSHCGARPGFSDRGGLCPSCGCDSLSEESAEVRPPRSGTELQVRQDIEEARLGSLSDSYGSLLCALGRHVQETLLRATTVYARRRDPGEPRHEGYVIDGSTWERYDDGDALCTRTFDDPRSPGGILRCVEPGRWYDGQGQWRCPRHMDEEASE